MFGFGLPPDLDNRRDGNSPHEEQSLNGMSAKEVLGVPKYREIESNIQAIENDKVQKEKERQEQIRLADQAQAAAARGDSSHSLALQMAAANVATVISSSRLHKQQVQTCAPMAVPAKGTKRRVGSGPSSDPPSAKKQRLSSVSSVVVGGASASSARSSASARGGGGGLKSSSASVISTKGRDAFVDVLAVDAADGKDKDKEQSLEELLETVMGPKSYSPGREIRWATERNQLGRMGGRFT
jgi:hypothetical protein